MGGPWRSAAQREVGSGQTFILHPLVAEHIGWGRAQLPALKRLAVY